MKEQNRVMLRGGAAAFSGVVQESLSEKVMLTVRPEGGGKLWSLLGDEGPNGATERKELS